MDRPTPGLRLEAITRPGQDIMRIWRTLRPVDHAFIQGIIGDVVMFTETPVDWIFLRTAAEFWDPEHAVFNFQGTELAPTIEEYTALIQRPTPTTHGIFVPNPFTTVQGQLSTLLHIPAQDIHEELHQRWDQGIRGGSARQDKGIPAPTLDLACRPYPPLLLITSVLLHRRRVFADRAPGTGYPTSRAQFLGMEAFWRCPGIVGVPLLGHLGSTLIFPGRVIRQLGGLQDISAEADRLPFRIQWADSTSTALARFLQIREIRRQRDASIIQRLYFPEHPTDDERAFAATSAYVARFYARGLAPPQRMAEGDRVDVSEEVNPSVPTLSQPPPTQAPLPLTPAGVLPAYSDALPTHLPPPASSGAPLPPASPTSAATNDQARIAALEGTVNQMATNMAELLALLRGPNRASSSSTPPPGPGPAVDPTPWAPLTQAPEIVEAPAPPTLYTSTVHPFTSQLLPPPPAPTVVPLPPATFLSSEHILSAPPPVSIPAPAMAYTVPPPMIQLFHSTLRGVYYSHLLAHTSSFSNLIEAGKKLDLGIKLGRMEDPTNKGEESLKMVLATSSSSSGRRGKEISPLNTNLRLLGLLRRLNGPRPLKVNRAVQCNHDPADNTRPCRSHFPTSSGKFVIRSGQRRPARTSIQPFKIRASNANPLPDHGPAQGPSINMITVCTSSEGEGKQGWPSPFVIEYVPAETAVGFAGIDAPQAPLVIDIPAREPYSNDRVPWTYEGGVGNLEQQFGVMGITRSGRLYENPATTDKGKAPATEVETRPRTLPTPSKKRIITVKGEEDYAIYKETAVSYISVGDDESLPFHSFETISVIRDYGEVGPSRADRMIGKVLLRHNYIPGTGLGARGQGISGPIVVEEYKHRRGLDFRPSCHEIIEVHRGNHLHRLATHYGRLNRGIPVPPLSHFFPGPPLIIGSTSDGPSSDFDDTTDALPTVYTVTEEILSE
ncbi:hypothetical protein CRG98_030557, partial [Punica granatum]